MTARQLSIPTIENLEPRVLLSDTPIASLLANYQALDVSPTGSMSVAGELIADSPEYAYQFTAPAKGRVNIQMNALGGDLDTLLNVYNSKGKRIRRNNNAAKGQTDSKIRLKVKAGRTYYIVADSAKGSLGQYELVLTSDPVDDYGDNVDSAKPVKVRKNGKAVKSGKVNYGSDVDVLAVTASKTGTMSVTMARLGRRASLDCDLEACDEAGNLLAQNAGFGSQQSVVTFNVIAGQTYYLKAAGVNESVGRYRVRILTSSPAPSPLPDPTPQPDPTPEPDPIPEPDPQFEPGSTVATQVLYADGLAQLLVLGTDGNDSITLTQLAGLTTLTTQSGGETFEDAFSEIIIYGFSGDDVIRTTYSVSTNMWVYAGAGADTIFDAGTGRATLHGGAGDDLLVSIGGANDALTGGEGFDSFWIDSTDSVFDASTTERSALAVHQVTEFYQPYAASPADADYVSLQIAGQPLRDPTVTGYAAGYANFASVPLFVDGPQYDDIEQGYIGDCYYLASLAGYAQTDPDIITQMIAPLGDGTYAVRFFRKGREVYLRIDADLPVRYDGSLAYASLGADGEAWVPLVEKAYAYFRYDSNSYASIEGGWMTTVYSEITNLSTALRWTSSRSASEIYAYIANNLQAGHAVSLGSRAGGAGPIVGSHAYAVLSTRTEAGLKYVTVHNPWGVDGRPYDANPYDGVLEITAEQLKDAFIAVAVSIA
ncbi:MAG: pre-peptidase C-terminal domain-containing protein [Planctomycetes bacterium]|nr:pre-peptidase C-terminal domain-containing protein [Planctomycetota bacterium]